MTHEEARDPRLTPRNRAAIALARQQTGNDFDRLLIADLLKAIDNLLLPTAQTARVPTREEIAGIVYRVALRVLGTASAGTLRTLGHEIADALLHTPDTDATASPRYKPGDWPDEDHSPIHEGGQSHSVKVKAVPTDATGGV